MRAARATRGYRFAFVVLLAVGVGACCAAWLMSGGVRAGLSVAAAADPRWMVVAGVCFGVSVGATASAWRVAFSLLGASVGRLQACAWFASGSLVNTFCPSPVGDAVRAALFSRAVPETEGRLVRSGGAFGALAVSRATVQAAVFACAFLTGTVPLWPMLVLASGAGVFVGVAFALGRRRRALLVRLSEATMASVRRPRLAIRLTRWTLVAGVARVAAAASVSTAVAAPHPWLCALAITAALDVAAALPISPGGVGITSGAVSVALASQGIGLATALAAGVVFHVVETAASLAFAGAVLPLASRPRLAARPALRVAVAVAAVALIAGAAAPSVLDFV